MPNLSPVTSVNMVIDYRYKIISLNDKEHLFDDFIFLAKKSKFMISNTEL